MPKTATAKQNSPTADPLGDHARLDGLWQAAMSEDGSTAAGASKPKPLQIRIHQDLFVFNPGPREKVYAFTLNPEVTPKAIDLTLVDKMSTDPKVLPGIYKVEKDKLTISLAKDKSSAERPKEFKAKGTDGYELITLERVQPAK